jgi:hypothetical protein
MLFSTTKGMAIDKSELNLTKLCLVISYISWNTGFNQETHHSMNYINRVVPGTKELLGLWFE